MTNTELKRLENNKKVTHCYIKKGPYYRPNACGYTDYVVRAGVYTKEEAIEHAKHCRELRLIPINVAEHNKFIKEEIQDLLSRIL